MKKRDIPTVVWLCPILPFINDTEGNLISILEECKINNEKNTHAVIAIVIIEIPGTNCSPSIHNIPINTPSQNA